MSVEPEDKVPSSDLKTDTGRENSRKKDNGIVLVPQPTDDPEDPLVSKNYHDRK